MKKIIGKEHGISQEEYEGYLNEILDEQNMKFNISSDFIDKLAKKIKAHFIGCEPFFTSGYMYS